MNSHLKCVPSLRTFTTGRLSGGDLEGFGWETNRSLNAEVFGLGTLDELLAHLFKRGDLPASESDADLMSFLCSLLIRGQSLRREMSSRNTDRAFAELFLGLLVRHCDPSRLEL